MRNLLTTLAALAAGATAMYYLDPEAGRRRRAVVLDKAGSATQRAGTLAQAQGRHALDRMKGILATGRAQWAGASGPLDDRKLHDRVRARLGRLVAHPKAVQVMVVEGRVRLTGDVSAREIDRLVSTVCGIPGVRSVENVLSVHDDAHGSAESTQRPRRQAGGERPDWRPLVPLLAWTAPLALVLRGRSGGPVRRERRAVRIPL